MKTVAYIGIGSNLGNKSKNVQQALDFISALQGVKVKQQSSLYLTAPWGKTDQDDFINQVVAVETDLAPLELLHKLQAIEIKLGRQRDVQWGPRTIDLDILLYGEEVIDLEELKVPHPYLKQRLFVLIPLQELNPELELPDGSKLREVLSTAEARSDGKDIINMVN
jgi:2-amino-4-hydroxy-6-hydroxymethyldihydropteridine diphosphokinase